MPFHADLPVLGDFTSQEAIDAFRRLIGGERNGGTGSGLGSVGKKALTKAQMAGIRAHVAHGHTIAEDPFLTPSALKAAATGTGCIWPARPDPVTGACRVFMGDQPGRDTAPGFGGTAVMGQFGAALQPLVASSTTLRCLRGMVLGMDNLCYNRRDLKNDERKWPRGRRPLLTGGEMRCISVASRAASKLETKTKQLRKMGMLKPLPKRSRAPRAAAPPRGITVIDTE